MPDILLGARTENQEKPDQRYKDLAVTRVTDTHALLQGGDV